MAEQKIAVVTGATSGLGQFIAFGLARAGYHTMIVARNMQRGEATRQAIAIEVPNASSELVLADLALVAEARRAGETIAAKYGAVHLLINNAGLLTPRRQVTSEGHERTLAVNHLAPFALTQALEGSLRQAASARVGSVRVVNVGSTASERVRLRLNDVESMRGLTPWGAYGRSKLALLMASFEWSRRLAGTAVAINVVHPGLVATQIAALPGPIGIGWALLRPFMISPEQGSDTPLFVALSPTLDDVTGQYFKRRKPARPNPQALSGETTQRLWVETERLVNAT